eukprot:scaffold10327_cov156-Cylindrotheca_fusiformis.AAC.2
MEVQRHEEAPKGGSGRLEQHQPTATECEGAEIGPRARQLGAGCEGQEPREESPKPRAALEGLSCGRHSQSG